MNTPHTAHRTLHTTHSLPSALSAHSLLSTLSPLLFALALLLSSCADTLDDALTPGLTPGTPTGSGPALTFQLPDRPAYDATTRTVPGAPAPEPWQEGDQLLVLLSITPYDGNATDHGSIISNYRIYTTLTCHTNSVDSRSNSNSSSVYRGGGSACADGGVAGTKLNSPAGANSPALKGTPSINRGGVAAQYWTLDFSGALASYTPAGATAPGPILPLAQLPLLVTDNNGTVSLNLPTEVASGAYTSISATLTYAPALQWQTENATDADGNALKAIRPLRQCAKPGTLPGLTEHWQSDVISQQLNPQNDAFTLDLSKAQFLPIGSRLRVYTGQPGNEITLLCPHFLPSAGEPAADHAYTTTTDAQGNAYFYGTTALASAPDAPITLDGSGPTDGSDADLRFIVSSRLVPGIEETDVTLLTASPSVPVSMTTSNAASQAIDASLFLSIAQNKDFVILDATQFDATTEGKAALKATLTTATAKGKTVWQISGLAVESSNQNAVSQRINAIKDALSAVYQTDNNTRITLYLPDATKLGSSAFQNCNALTRASLPLLETVENTTFTGCTNLTSVTLPLLNTAEYNTFYGCSKLTDITLPLLNTAGDGTFYKCSSLISVTLPLLNTAGDDTFYKCSSLISVTLPLLETAGNETFESCTNLTSVTLPLLETAGNSTFNGCTKLTSVTLPLLETAGNSTFNGCTKLTSVTLPLLNTAGYNTFSNCSNLTSVTLPLLNTAGNSTFDGCTKLTSVTLPELTTISGNTTFRGCTVLRYVKMPKLQKMGGYTFQNCSELTDITLPSLNTVGTGTFWDCLKLITVSLPKLTATQTYTFQNCPKLTSVTFGTPLTAWDSNVFYNVTTTNLTLTLSPEQKIFTGGGGSVGTLTKNPFDWNAGGKAFGGYTFKAIKKYVAPTAGE